MRTSSTTLQTAAFAFLSGIPGLVYQVVWTREVGLLAGGQIEAVSIVLVAFFGGLALGADRLGPLADRVASPLRLYGGLEIASGLAAAASIPALRALGDAARLEGGALLVACCAVMLPATFLLGGTLPALLRAVARSPDTAAGHAGRLVGANTVGAVVGVGVAIAAIPTVGLRFSTWAAAAAAVSVGAVAAAVARPSPLPQPEAASHVGASGAVLVAAAFVGAATLGYEVIATRLATLRLGSSLYAWGLVLGLFLAGLAAGNLAAAGRARRTPRPEADLGWIEVGAACAVAVGLGLLRPEVSSVAVGLTQSALLTVAAGVLPAAVAMGAAFPFLVRLAVAGPRLGGAFGRVSAANTAGGIVGALLAPFVLLPALGSAGSVITFAALNAIVGLAFLARAGPRRRSLGVAAVFLVLACVTATLRPAAPPTPWVLYVDEGRQATAVVTAKGGHRTLNVDGDPEAATLGSARRTEELLAVLPMLLHPEPRSFLEVGLGSGITLGTAHRFALERIECVEIAGSVIRAARYFEPDNRGIADPARGAVTRGDARVFLASRHSEFDVIAANTLHPWSVGSTGLYSLEYFERIARALRPGGIAVQWLPTARIGRRSMELILRTFFSAFPHGELWLGASNVIVIGALEPLPPPDAKRAVARLRAAGMEWERFGVSDFGEFSRRRVAGAPAVRSALGDGDVLLDDRPVIEVLAANQRGIAGQAEVSALLVEVARAGTERSPASGAALLWLESLEARAEGDERRADAREALAAAAGLPDAIAAGAARRGREAHREFQAGHLDTAERGFREAIALDSNQLAARFALAGIASRRGDLAAAEKELRELIRRRPDEPVAHNELSGVLVRKGERAAARRAVEQALALNPFYLEALANAGLMAADAGDFATAQALLERLRSIGPLGTSPQESALARALATAASASR